MDLPAMVGVHIGQEPDFTAIVEVYFSGYSHTVINITRLPADTHYNKLLEFLIKRIKILRMDGDYRVKIRVDATLIGSPVIDLIRSKIHNLIDVYLVGGYKPENKEDILMLPKELMLSHLKLLFQRDRISASFDKPESLMTNQEKQRLELFNSLKTEILSYKTKVHVDVAHWNPEGRTGEHDDLAIAMGLACWPL